MKETWKTINQVLNKSSKSSSIDSLQGSDSEIFHKKDISNTMNQFFYSVGKDLANKLLLILFHQAATKSTLIREDFIPKVIILTLEVDFLL